MRPKVSAITSFDIDHFRHANWPHAEIRDVELYAFMQSSIDRLFPESSYPGPQSARSALKLMATASKRSGEALRIADEIAKHFIECNIVGLSTFIPEIGSHKRCSEAWIDAQDALCFLVDLAALLKEQFGHSCSFLEMVGGNYLDGVWKGYDGARETYVVNRVFPEKGIDRLLERLLSVATRANEKGIALALELEPGPLFAISGLASLLLLCEKLENSHSVLHNSVGINLDIAHWSCLANISVNEILAQQCVTKRIVHAHISDHSRGHFSDAMPSTFHAADYFLPWLELLGGLPVSRKESMLAYSGFLSCEIECAPDVETVILSKKVVEKWLECCAL